MDPPSRFSASMKSSAKAMQRQRRQASIFSYHPPLGPPCPGRRTHQSINKQAYRNWNREPAESATASLRGSTIGEVQGSDGGRLSFGWGNGDKVRSSAVRARTAYGLEHQHGYLRIKSTTMPTPFNRNPTASAPSAPPVNAAIAALRSGDAAGAEWLLRGHLAQYPQDAAAMAKLAEIVGDQGRPDEAIQLFRQILQLRPDAHPARLALAKVLQQRGDPNAALEQVQELPPAVRATFDVRTFEAAVLANLGRHQQQAEIYDKLLRKHPTNARLWMTFGNALVYGGRTVQAIRALRRAVSIQPTFGEGWWSLANLKTFRFDPADIATMRKALSSDLAPADALHLNFALGKALEDCSEFEASFRHYAQGNCIRSEGFSPAQMDLGRLRDDVDNAIATFDRPLFDRPELKGHAARDPIFIVGLQRSGSTLIEQIIASHPLIEGTSELDAMLHIWSDLCRTAEGSGRTVWQDIRLLDSQRLSEIGADYLERTRPFRTTDRPFLVDKRPANWIYVGLIRMALPNATIIDARRHPMACGFSNFKQHYAGGAPFSYSLPLIGKYYAEYLRLMDHFDQVQPDLVHHVLNEDLIDDPEREVRQMLDRIGVPFDPACLDFHRNRRTVRSPSAEQVRRPINRDGVDQWRHFEPWLHPLKIALGPALESWANVNS